MSTKLKTISTLAISFALLASLTSATFAFPDISDAKYKSGIMYLEENNIVNGFSDGQYKPNREITRAEFTKIVINSKYSQSEINTCTGTSFSDVPGDHHFVNFICVAEKNEVIHGFTDGMFKPEDAITAAEAAKVVVNAYGFDIAQNENTPHSEFLNKLTMENALPANISDTNANLLRGDMAQIIYRLDVDTIAETAIATEDLSSLVAALTQAELVDTFLGEDEFTVFAPVNSAFAKLDAATLDGLLNNDSQKEALTGILTYHVVPGKVMAADVVNLTSATTLNGDVSIRVENGEVFVNDSKVIATDIETSNGVVHLIDSVLLP